MPTPPTILGRMQALGRAIGDNDPEGTVGYARHLGLCLTVPAGLVVPPLLPPSSMAGGSFDGTAIFHSVFQVIPNAAGGALVEGIRIAAIASGNVHVRVVPVASLLAIVIPQAVTPYRVAQRASSATFQGGSATVAAAPGDPTLYVVSTSPLDSWGPIYIPNGQALELAFQVVNTSMRVACIVRDVEDSLPENR